MAAFGTKNVQWCIDRKHQKVERERIYRLMLHEGPLLLQVSNILWLIKSWISQKCKKLCPTNGRKM